MLKKFNNFLILIKMNNYSFSQLTTYVMQNVFLFAFTNNVNSLRDYLTKHSPKNELLSKLVFRFSDSIMSEKQKNEAIDSPTFLNGENLPSLKNGSLQLVYNSFYKNHIIVVNNNFAIMVNPSILTNEAEKTAYNSTLVSLFLHLASPNTIQHDAKQIAKTLSIVTPYPYSKTFINSLKYMSDEIQKSFIDLNDNFTPVKNEVQFFSFAPKVEKAKSEKAVTPTAKNETAKNEVVTPPPVNTSPKLKAVDKMKILFDAEKLRVSKLPNNKSKIGLVQSLDKHTAESWCKVAHENSTLKTASFATFLNDAIAKNA